MIADAYLRDNSLYPIDSVSAIKAIDDNFAIPDKRMDIFEYLKLDPVSLSETMEEL